MSTDTPTPLRGVRGFARRHSLGVAAAVSAVALGLVFAVVGGVVPGTLLPRAPPTVVDAIPTLNAIVSLAAIATVVGGVRAARASDYDSHRRLMLATTGLFAAFLAMYLYRIALVGTTEFGGPAAVERFVYLPLLAVHVLLAIVCVPLVVYVLTLAATRPPSDLFDTAHARIGRVAASLWLVSFSLGVVVYVLLYRIY